jgi:hypothetical protein
MVEERESRYNYIWKDTADFPRVNSQTFSHIQCETQIYEKGFTFFLYLIITWIWWIDYLRFYVPLKNISLIWRRHHCRWRAAKFRPMLGAQGLWAGRDLYSATPTVTRDLLIRRTAPFSRLLRHTRGCGGSILTRILTGSLEYGVYISYCLKRTRHSACHACLNWYRLLTCWCYRNFDNLF